MLDNKQHMANIKAKTETILSIIGPSGDTKEAVTSSFATGQAALSLAIVDNIGLLVDSQLIPKDLGQALIQDAMQLGRNMHKAIKAQIMLADVKKQETENSTAKSPKELH